jgi:hypothetical protein
MKHFQPRIQNQQGVALVITLGILAVLLILVIGFAVSMRTEQVAARNFSYVVVARQLAHAAVDEAIFLIRTNTPVISSSAYYVTGPGRIAGVDSLGLFADLLFSSNSVSGLGTININSDQSIIASNAEYRTTPDRAIWVDWIYVSTNGQASGAPLLGRYAFWVDDEAAKINVNIAARRFEDFGGSTSNIDLTALKGVGAVSYTNTTFYARNTGYFTTEQWKDTPTVGAGWYNVNKAYVTAYGADANLTPWGTRRVDLNTATFDEITNALDNAALASSPLTAGFATRTFRQKYGDYGINQIAANIIDFRDGDDNSTTDSQTTPTYLGLEETPYFNELVFSNRFDSTPVTGKAHISLLVELVNPYSTAKGLNYTIDGTYTINITTAPLSAGSPYTGPFTISVSAAVPPKGYAVYRATLLDDPAIAGASAGSYVLTYRLDNVRLLNAAGNIVDYIPLVTFPTNALTGGTTSVDTNIVALRTRSLEINDPRQNASGWVQVPNNTHTLGAQNRSTVINFMTTFASATDLTDDGTETTSAQIVNRSTFYIKNRPFESPAELGFIAVGTNIAGVATAVPWRTIRLQPRVAGNNIPDWLMLDIFTTTNAAPTNALGHVLGRLNLNQSIANRVAGVPAPRTIPPLALFNGMNFRIIASNEWQTLAQNVANRTMVGGYTPPIPGVYNFVGEICEVDQLANTAVGSDVKSNREARVAAIANLVTVRSNTFTIWAVGQAIQDVNGNGVFDAGDLIVAEAKAQAVVERYEEAGKVKFRTLYFRYLTE